MIRFNPSPFERDGVPGLGWAVGAPEQPAALTSVELREGDDGAIVANGIEWTPRTDASAYATVDGRSLELGPARIETIRVST